MALEVVGSTPIAHPKKSCTSVQDFFIGAEAPDIITPGVYPHLPLDKARVRVYNKKE